MSEHDQLPDSDNEQHTRFILSPYSALPDYFGLNTGAAQPWAAPITVPLVAPSQLRPMAEPITEERLRAIVVEVIQRVLHPESDGFVASEHRRIRQWDADGTEWRGVLYRVEKEMDL